MLATTVAAPSADARENDKPSEHRHHTRHHTGCNTAACEKRVADRHHRQAERKWIRLCSQTRPRACVERAIVTYRLTGWQAAWMRRVPQCESHYNPYAHNPSGSSGLYQFMPGTWATTRYARHSIWSAKWSSLAAADFARRGLTHHWVCK